MDQVDYPVHRCSGLQQRSTMMKISCLYSDSMLPSDTALCVTDEQFGLLHELSSEQAWCPWPPWLITFKCATIFLCGSTATVSKHTANDNQLLVPINVEVSAHHLKWVLKNSTIVMYTLFIHQMTWCRLVSQHVSCHTSRALLLWLKHVLRHLMAWHRHVNARPG